MKDNILTRINNYYEKSSKKQKKISDYILRHYDLAAYMTAAKLGQAINVSESTVVRFAVDLGYDGYPQMQKALKDVIKTRLTTIDRVRMSSARIDEKNIAKHILQSDIERIKSTLYDLDEDIFNRVIDKILGARHCYIVGTRSSASLASFMGFYFNWMFENVKVITTNSESEIFESIHRISSKDIMIGVTFPRYSHRTLRAMEYSMKRQAKVIAITDASSSPASKCSDLALFAKADTESVVDSLVAPMSVVNAIIVALSIKRKDAIEENLSALENMWLESGVYEEYKEEVEY